MKSTSVTAYLEKDRARGAYKARPKSTGRTAPTNWMSYEIARFVLVLLKNPVFTHLLLVRNGFKILPPLQPELPFNSRSEQFL